MMEKINNPHDKFFRKAMLNPKVAREFLRQYLPPELVAAVDWNYLELEEKSFITDAGRDLFADLVFKTKIANRDAYLCFLIEHQSTPDKMLPFRVDQYKIEIRAGIVRMTGEKSIPLIFPLVIYHGKRDYCYSNDIRDLVDAPRELINKFFSKPFHLVNLNIIEDKELKKQQWSGLMTLVMKHIFDKDILPSLMGIFDLVVQIEQAGGHEFVALVLEYLVREGEVKNSDALIDLARQQLPSKIGDKVMTTAERFEARGEAIGEARGEAIGEARGEAIGEARGEVIGEARGEVIGEARGEAKARQQIALKLLKETGSFQLAAKMTGYSIRKLKKLEQGIV